MLQISIPRIQRYGLLLGLAGAAITAFVRSVPEAAGFLVGAAISLVTIETWSKLAESLAPKTTAPEDPNAPALPGGNKPGSPVAAASLMVLRYMLIGGAIYGTIKVLGVSPVTMLIGLLVSFLAVVVELLTQVFKPR